jgi:hypothetical protein
MAEMAQWAIRFHHPRETSLPQKASTGRFVRPPVPRRRQPVRPGTGWPESQPRRKTERVRSPAQARAAVERKEPLPLVAMAERMVAPAAVRRRSRVLLPALTAAATSGPVRWSWRSRRHGVAATPHPPGRMAHIRARRYLPQTAKCPFHPKGEQARRTRDKSGRWLLPHDRSYGSSYVPSIPVALLPVIQRSAPGCRPFRRISRCLRGEQPAAPELHGTGVFRLFPLPPGEGVSSTLSRLRGVYKHRRASAIIISSCTESLDFPMAMRAEVAQW